MNEVRLERLARHCVRDWYLYALAVEVLPELPGSGCIASAGRGQAYGGTGTVRRDCSDRDSGTGHCST
jgi:hypothetical protein